MKKRKEKKAKQAQQGPERGPCDAGPEVLKHGGGAEARVRKPFKRGSGAEVHVRTPSNASPQRLQHKEAPLQWKKPMIILLPILSLKFPSLTMDINRKITLVAKKPHQTRK